MNSKLEKLTRTAYHEAGHAVMAFLVRRPFLKVTIIPDEDSLGSVHASPKFLTDIDILTSDPWSCRIRKKMENEIMVYLAGQIATERYSGESVKSGSSDDDFIARILLEMAWSEEEAGAYFDWLHLRTTNIICFELNWRLVEALAKELLIHKELSNRRARKVIKQARADLLQEAKDGKDWAKVNGKMTP